MNNNIENYKIEKFNIENFKDYPFIDVNESLIEKIFRYFLHSWRNKEVANKTKLKKNQKDSKLIEETSKKMKKLYYLPNELWGIVLSFAGKKSYYLPDELWDIVLSFAGIQKISNFEQLQNIDLHTLMQSYVNIHTHQKRNLIKINEEQNNKSKYSSYTKNYELMKNYIERDYNKLLKNNSLKQTLICFHIKLCVTFLSNYDSYKPLEIDLNIFSCEEAFYDLCENSKHCDKEYKITYKNNVRNDIIINWVFIDIDLFKANPYAVQFKYH